MHQHRRTGFTLLELTVSLSIMSVLMIGIASALVIASRSLPADDTPLVARVEAAQAIDMIADDLLSAQTVSSYTINTIVITVADRNNDDASESVRYAWSGTSGDPLVRSINGGADEVLVDEVADFTLTYDLRTGEQETPANPNESNETLLFYHDATKDLTGGHVHDDSWWGQYFMPILPPDAVSWSVTRAKFLMKRDHDNPGQTTISVTLPQADMTPSGTVLDSVVFDQLSLPKSWTWIESVFDVRGLSPTTGLCLTFTTSDPNSCQVRYRDKKVVLAGSALSFGNPAWQAPAANQALLFYVYGTVTTASPPDIVEVTHLVRVRINLTVVGAPDEPLETTISLWNVPEV